MWTSASQSYDHTVVSSGPDWITATAKRGSKFAQLTDLGFDLLNRKRDAGGAIHSASRFGYQGHSSGSIFCGIRDDDAMLQMSGPDLPAYTSPIIDAADNVSRLDLQVTVWTHGEQPHLAIESYQRLARSRHQRHRPGQVTLITSDPMGETLNVNKRTSDHFGRLYDKASEAKAGPPRTLWRYEVEFKRRAAMAHAHLIVGSDTVPSLTRNIVHSWWRKKGVEPTFTLPEGSRLETLKLEPKETDVIDWFEKSVSITVARAVKLRGLRVTLEALGLSALVQPREKEVENFYAARLGLVPSQAHRNHS